MAKFYSVGERIGTLTIVAVKPKLDAEGHPHPQPGLRLRLQPAWKPGLVTDMGGKITQELVNPGPDMIDTDKLSAENEMALDEFWGKEGQEKLDEWLSTVGKKRFNFVKGDPMPQQKIKVTLTREQLEQLREVDKTLPKPTEPEQFTGAQKVVTGPRTVGKK